MSYTPNKFHILYPLFRGCDKSWEWQSETELPFFNMYLNGDSYTVCEDGSLYFNSLNTSRCIYGMHADVEVFHPESNSRLILHWCNGNLRRITPLRVNGENLDPDTW